MQPVTSAEAWVPSGIDAVDPGWLTDALGATVTDVAAVQAMQQHLDQSKQRVVDAMLGAA